MSHHITAQHLFELECAAKAASPGPWHIERLYNGEECVRSASGALVTHPNVVYCRGEVPLREDVADRDKQFLSAANPAIVLALIADLRSERERFERYYRDVHAMMRECENGDVCSVGDVDDGYAKEER